MTYGIKIRSRTPGRMRFQVPALYHREEYKNKIEYYLGREPGIKKVEANPYTGRVLVLFDPEIEERRIALIILSARWQEPVEKKIEEELAHNLPLAETLLAGGTLAILSLKQVLKGKSRLTTDYTVLYISSAVSMIAGYPILKRGFEKTAQKGGINYELVMSIAAFATLVLRESLWGLAVVFLINFTTIIQEMTTRQAEKLYQMPPEQQISYLNTEIIPQKTFTAKTGDLIPADGIVLSGEAAVDESLLTGEYLPRFKNIGEKVYAGTRVMSGEIEVRAEKVGKDTRIGALLSMQGRNINLKTSWGQKGEKLAEKITHFAFAASIVVFIFSRDFLRVLAMLLCASPRACSLASTVPARLGAARAVREGILVKKISSLEKLADVDIILFDKTGTLTEANPVVSRILPLKGYTSDYVLKMAASLEMGSVHPLASAILSEARARNISPVQPTVSREVAGNGIKGFIMKQKVIVGSHDFMLKEGVDISGSEAKARRIRHYGESEIYVAKDGKITGLIGVKDTLRPTAEEMIYRLFKRGITRVGVISGDSPQASKRIAESCGIDLIESCLSPEDKVGIIESYKKQGCMVAMVGDGINDIPALESSDVGICYSRGLLPVQNFADIVILNENLENIPKTIIISHKVQQISLQNLNLALGINILGIALAALKIIDPFFAAVYYNLNSLVVMLNSMRVLKMKV